MTQTLTTGQSINSAETFSSLLADLCAGRIVHDFHNPATHMVVVIDWDTHRQVASVVKGDYDADGNITTDDSSAKLDFRVVASDCLAVRFPDEEIAAGLI